MMDNMEMSPESANTPSQDYSQGYMICVNVSPTGFTVEGPLPLAPEPQTEDLNHEQDHEEIDEEVPNVASALKHVLAIIKDHPLGEDAEAQMQAGYESR